MINQVEFLIEKETFNRCLEVSDWRFSAAAVGMVRFFKFTDKKYHFDKNGRKLYYNSKDIEVNGDDSDYLNFAENYFKNRMHHMTVLDLIQKQNLTEKDKNDIKNATEANTIMKKVFKGVKYDGENKDQIKKIIFSNRNELIKETFKNASYKKFINYKKFRTDAGKVCRLYGYYVDTGRKTKSISFCFNNKSRVYQDHIEFDFIPFAFTDGRTSVFINSNTSITDLVKSNDDMKDYLDRIKKNRSWNTLFYNYSKSGEFIANDVEVIVKNKDTKFYETVMLRNTALDIFKELEKNNSNGYFKKPIDFVLSEKLGLENNYELRIMEETTNAILNDLVLDELIEIIIRYSKKEDKSENEESNKKEKSSKKEENDNKYDAFLISQLIRVNTIIYKFRGILEVNMEKEKYLKMAYHSARKTVGKLKEINSENKISGYRQKLTSALIARDYNRFIEIMLQLSSYTELSFGFLHYLIQDFESNKNLAYNFVNSLIETEEKGE